jgi:DNA polymerase III subunit epsilon
MLPGTGRLALRALLEKARLPTWRLWARDAAVERKDVLKARRYTWSPGEFGRHTMIPAAPLFFNLNKTRANVDIFFLRK